MTSSILKGFWALREWGLLAGMRSIWPVLIVLAAPERVILASPSMANTNAAKGAVCSLRP